MDVATSALAEAFGAALLQSGLIVKLVSNGILSKEDAIAIIDSTIFVLERHRLDANGPGYVVIDYARSRLEALLRHIDAMPPKEP